MTNIVPMANAALQAYDARQLRLIRDTVAKDCNDLEFDQYIAYCRALQLDPLRRQIYAFVFNKSDPSKRNMSIVIGIDGFRSIAARTGNYRPGRTTYETDPELKDPRSNPVGLVSATASVFMFSHGEWHEVIETAYWDEHAPMKQDGDFIMVETDQKWPDGNPKKRKQFTGETRWVLDDKTQWPKMSRLMLAKVAEAKALRRAWPDNFANVYGEEEVDRAKAAEPDILSPSEAVALADIEARREAAGIKGHTIMLDLMEGEMAALKPVAVGQFFDRVAEFVDRNKNEPSQIRKFAERNQFGLREFWSFNPKDCKALKKLIEDAVNNPPSDEPGGEAA